jgi:ParD-like antitoxin of type II bacterial toxin-antitoxin system
MGTPLKVSESLYEAARQESQAAERSITGQIEHWARIGRAVEALVAHQELLALKKAGDLLDPVFPTAARRKQVHDVLTGIAATSDRTAAQAVIASSSGSRRYATDSAFPGLVLEILPDGTRRPGRLQGRRFVPVDAKPRRKPR